jgi:uncharacterized membrane protein
MTKNRLEAFSDGVIAIVITIMVLELKVPHGTDFAALRPLVPRFLSYALSFVFLAIYWNNHHHMMHACSRVNGRILWANMHLLFWLSLIPFVTGWMGENHFAPEPTALYGFVLIMDAVAYSILTREIVLCHGPDSVLAAAIGDDRKGRLSLVAYIAALPLAFVETRIAHSIYVLVAMVWLVPDRRIESKLGHEPRLR